MNDELEAGQLEGPFRTRAELGPLPIWTHPVHLCDKNKDGKTSRSEAKASGITVDATDLNDDGRTTRSEARLSARAMKR